MSYNPYSDPAFLSSVLNGGQPQAPQADYQKILADPSLIRQPGDALAYVIQALGAGDNAAAQQLMQKTGVTQQQVDQQLANTPGRNEGTIGKIAGGIKSVVQPIGQYVTDHPAALFAAPFIAAGALGAFGGSLGAAGGAGVGDIGSGVTSGVFSGGAPAVAGGAEAGTNVLGAGGLFGAGGAPTTLAGLGGGGGSALAGGLADSVAAGTAGLGAGMGGVAGAGGGLFSGLGPGSATAGQGIGGTVGEGAGVSGSGGSVLGAAGDGNDLLANLSSAFGGSAGSGGGGIVQSLLGALGGQPGNLGSNIFAGLQGAGLLSSLLGGNGLSDMMGLTGQNASKFAGVNTAGPGGSSSTYDPNTNTVTGSAGNLDPLQAQFAKYSGDQLGQADQSKQQGNILDLLRKQSQPYEQNAMNTLNNNLFSRGRLGMEDSNTGTAYKEFAKGLDENDMQRQLAAYQYAQGASNQAFNQSTSAANSARQIQLGSFAPTMASITPNTNQGGSNPTLDLLHQFLTGVKP